MNKDFRHSDNVSPQLKAECGTNDFSFITPLPKAGEAERSSYEGDLAKKNLRTKVKELRKYLNIEELSAKFVKLIQTSEEYKNSKHILLFYPKKYEINLLDLLKDSSKIFYLPKINGENLLCCPFNKDDELCESCFKTKEPTTSPVEKSIIDLIIVPALAVDKNNYRLGYGGGFYDKFLSDAKAKTLTCVPKELYIETIYPNEFDIKISKIILA